jgi:hypothetical protein
VLHTEKKAARLVASEKDHYIFGATENQVKLWKAALDPGDGIDLAHLGHESCERAHRRIDRHRVWSAPAS